MSQPLDGELEMIASMDEATLRRTLRYIQNRLEPLVAVSRVENHEPNKLGASK